MTSVKSQAEIHEWKCASRGSAFERAGEARDSARPRRSARFFQSRRPTARCRALTSDRDPVPTQAREPAATSKYHFGAAPGAPTTAPSRGFPPTLASPRIRESCGQNKSKCQRGFRLRLRWRAAREQAGEAGPGPGCVVKPDPRPAAAFPPQPIQAWDCRAGESSGAPSLPPRPLGRPEPPPWGRGRADWAPRSGDGRGGRYINPKRSAKEAGGKDARELGQTLQPRSEFELAVRTVPPAPPDARNCPRGWGPLHGVGCLKPPPPHTPPGDAQRQPSRQDHRSSDNLGARLAEEGVLGAAASVSRETPPRGNSLVWYLPGFPFGFFFFFKVRWGHRENGEVAFLPFARLLRSPPNSERGRRQEKKESGEGATYPKQSPRARRPGREPRLCLRSRRRRARPGRSQPRRVASSRGRPDTPARGSGSRSRSGSGSALAPARTNPRSPPPPPPPQLRFH